MDAILRTYRRAYAGLPREVWLLSVVIFVNRCGTMVLPFLALYLRHEQGFSAAGAGQMLAVYGVGGIAGAQLGGRLTQRYGGVLVAFVGMSLAVPGFVAIPWCGTGAGLMIALLYLSTVFESMRPAIGAATIEFCPDDRHAKAFALNRLMMNLGMSIGPVVGGVLATIDYTLLFWVNALFVGLSAAVLGLSFGLHRSSGRRQAKVPTARGRSPWSDRRYLLFLGLQLASALVFFQLIGALPLYWSEQLGLSEFRIGMLFVLNTLLIVVFEMVLTDWLRDRPPLRLVAWGVALVGLGFGLTPFGDSFLFACWLVPIWTLGEMLSSPFVLAYIAKASQGGQRGEYIGLFSTTMAVALVLSPLLGTSLYTIDPRLPWWCALATAAVLPFGFLALARGEESAASEAALHQTPTKTLLPTSAAVADQHAEQQQRAASWLGDAKRR